ncbi:two-partner secretion domain-containing protein [Pseudoduganella sp. OTU4001]|uniref:two-partner secretion domain-containing protein n=1 Tax=Pseudoduganella sp. OTU4001 TaxID=3043854 RepID=UPI00313F11C1
MKQNKPCQLALLSLAVAACFGSVQANPVAPQVVAGQASFQQQGNVFTVTNAPNTIINWQSFSVEANEVTRFLQQSADSKVLNRITGQDPSRILGTLQSNGKVFLINPNGILFGKDARVDVQGLAASSLGMSNADFLAGRLDFSAQGAAGKVENQGSISTARGGQVYLVAPDVKNSGIINAPGGAVMLAAGHSVQLVDAADPSVQVVVSAPADSALNLGQVVAQGGRIGIFGALVNQRGVASADSAVLGENGKVLLRSSSRTMVEGGSLTSARGGEVAVLGPQVGVTGNARIDASGAQDGGAVLVGGDYRGANAAVPNAQQVYVGKDAVLAADAGASGKGGKVIVWADQSARVHGSLSARGGAAGGNGGLIETSGQQLDLAGLRVDAGAAKGQRGDWLLDPYDIAVGATGSVGLEDVDLFDDGASSGMTQIAASLLNGATANVILQAKHDIFFNEAVSITNPGVGLTALAGNDVNVNAALTTNGGAVKLVAGDSSSGATATTANLTLAAGISTGGGSVELKGAGLSLQNGVAVSGQEMRLLADSIDVASTASLASTTSVYIAPRTSGNAITLGGSSGSSSTLNLTNSVLGAISAQDLTIGTSANAVSVSGAVDLSSSSAGSSALTLTGSTLNIGAGLRSKSRLNLYSTGAISGSGAITAPSLDASGDSITLDGANQVGILRAMAAGDISFRTTGALHLGSWDGPSGVQSSSAGNVTLEASAITQETDASVQAGTLTLKSSGQVDLTTSWDNHANKLVAQNVGDLQYTDSSNLEVSSLSLASGGTGQLWVNAGGTLSISGTVDSRNGSMELAGGNVALGSGAVVNGRTIKLKGSSEGISTAAGSSIAGNYVTLQTNGLSLGGTVQGITSAALEDSGQVTLANPGGTIQLGSVATQFGGFALTLDSSTLSKITARQLVLDNRFSEVIAGMYVGALDISSMPLSDSLILRSGSTVNFSGTLKLPSAANLKAYAGSSLTTNSAAQLQAHGVHLEGQSLSLASGSITADVVSLYSSNDVELGGTTATATVPTYLPASVLGAITSSSLHIGSGGAMKVGGALGSSGMNLALEAQGGKLTIAAPVQASSIKLAADAMEFSDFVTAGTAVLAPSTSGHSVTIGATCTGSCLSLTDLSYIKATTVGIGSNQAGGTSAITLAGAANLDGVTNRLALFSNGAITQDSNTAAAALTVNELGIDAGSDVVLDHASNQVGKLAASVGSGDITFRNAQSVAIASMNGGNAALDTDYAINGVVDNGTVNMNVTGSLTSSGATIQANKLAATASGSIGTATSPLLTKVAMLHAESTASSGNAPINITNNSGAPSSLSVIKLKTNTGNAGNIVLNNYGATEVATGGEVASDSGDISLTAHSPLTINGRVESSSGDITLVAGSSGSSGDNLVINNLVRTAGGNITLRAGADITYASSNVVAPNGTITNAANENTPTVPTPPTLAQCVANPGLSGCDSVLPSLGQCVSNPTAAGCSVVLPSLGECVANPNAAGCSAVLPSLSQCVANPSAAGCAAVLPSLSQCVANPNAAGCSAVLPSLAQCVANPSAAGCSAVLPSLGQCVANPSAAGCSAVLPSLAQCVANPGAAGCSAVLPSLSQCVANPTAPGCAAVLPSLSQCVATPAAAGCEAVLPSISQCVATPTAPGCQVVLPSINQCVATPTAPGCQAVLPSLSQCVATPAAPGCSVVLPPLTQCVATPTAAGCEAVLPPLSQCIATPAAPGCQAVLPSISQCVATPKAAGCQVVLPSLNQCVATPAAPGCQVVLPSLGQCLATPSAPGCSVVLPSISQCVANPAAQGCQVVLPSISQCVATPSAPGCSVVLPSISQCVANPSAQGCQVVLPTLGQCVANPSAQGCQVVLPSLSQCVATPSAQGCQVVLPSISQCVANPSAQGCQVVLPTLGQCVANPSAPGCQVVLPSLSQCVAAPTAAGCSVVLPSLNQCVATPSAQGCQVVLPSLGQCVATPGAAGCSVVLPSISQCVASPTAQGCQVVLPTLNQCVASPATAGCSVVLPSLTQCIGSPTLAGCVAVLPSINQCAASPTLAGCEVVLPRQDNCAAKPNLPLCQVVSPPSVGQPANPVQLAVNQTVQTINQSTAQVGGGKNVTAPTGAGGSSSSSSSNSGSSGSGGPAATSDTPGDKEKKSEDTAGTKEDTSKAKKDDPAKKMYCN